MPFATRNVVVMAQFKKAGINTAPSSAPTVNYIQAGGSATIGQTASITDATNFPGSYYYTLSGVTEGTYEANFHTSDATVDQQDISVGFSVDPLPLLQSNLVLNNGTAQGGAPSSITLAASASGIDGMYGTDVLVEIVGGTGVGQVRAGAAGYVGATKVLPVTPAWTTQPDATSQYVITPDNSSDPWATVLPGPYGVTQAGGILGAVGSKANLIGVPGTQVFTTGPILGVRTFIRGMDYVGPDFPIIVTAPAGWPSFINGTNIQLVLNGGSPISGTVLNAGQLTYNVPSTAFNSLVAGSFKASVRLADGNTVVPEFSQLQIIG